MTVHPRRTAVRLAALAVASTLILAVPAAPTLGAGTACSVTNRRSGKTFTTLLSAVIKAKANDSLTLAGTCAGGVGITRPLTITGVRGAGTPTVDANGGGIGISAGSGAKVTLVKLTIRGARGAGMGVIVNAGASATLRSVVITDNSGSGSALTSNGRTLVTGRSRITGNTSTGSGGGISVGSGGLTLTGRTVVTGNSAIRGGGAYVGDGTLRLLGKARIAGNTTANEGGGVRVYIGELRIGRRASIAGNTAGTAGGGVSAFAGTVVVNGNARIHHNTSESTGGAIDIDPVASVARLTMSGNARIDHNVADDGAAIWGEGAIILRDQARIDRNSVSGDLASGSTVYLFAIGPDGATVTLSDEARIRDNTAGPTGAAVYFLMTCGPVDPTISGAAGRVIGNAPRNVKRSNDPCL